MGFGVVVVVVMVVVIVVVDQEGVVLVAWQGWGSRVPLGWEAGDSQQLCFSLGKVWRNSGPLQEDGNFWTQSAFGALNGVRMGLSRTVS